MKRSKKIALLALMFALIIIFNFVPIPTVAGVTLGLMILPVLIMAQTGDFKMTMICALFMGVTNLVSWYTVKAGNLMAPVFQNPLVCMLPRLTVGVTAYFSHRGLLRAIALWQRRGARTETALSSEEEAAAAVSVPARKTRSGRALLSAAAEQAAGVVSAALGVLTNTLLVGVMAVLLYNGRAFGGTAISPAYIVGLFGLNFTVEIIAFPLLTPPIAYALNKIR